MNQTFSMRRALRLALSGYALSALPLLAIALGLAPVLTSGLMIME